MKCNDMPLVSVITPVYNAAHWLPETLASVRAQTLTDWEHILVDDGSADGSVTIAEKAAKEDDRIHLLRMPSNGGPIAARNLALKAARGRFVAFLDADDLWLPDKLRCSIEWMTTHGYEFVYHDYRYMSHDGAYVGRLVSGPNTLNLRTLHTRRGTGCLTVVVDRQKTAEILFPQISPLHAEDFCLWSSIIQRGYIGHRIPLDLARYRLSPKSRSANKCGAAWNVWRLYRDESKLPLLQAIWWWMQYACSALWLHWYAHPRGN
jgi:hypothetical protein